MLRRRPARLVRIRDHHPGLKVAATAAVTVLALITVACSSAPKPERLPPQTMSSAPLPPVSEEAGPDPREPIAPLETESETDADEQRSPLTVVIDDGADTRVRGPSLVEAAAAERKRRETSERSTTVVTDKNLGQFRGAQLTEMGGSPASPPREPGQQSSNEPASTTPSDAPGTSGAGEPSSTGSAGKAARDAGDEEAYWRGRVLKARMNWAAAVEENHHLKSKVAELRQRFYAEEDPYYRDSQIKPSWDRALDRLGETREEIEEYRIEVRSVLEAGRRASALPGWLREGIDLEPDLVERDREDGPDPPGEHLPGEPKIAPDPDGRR